MLASLSGPLRDPRMLAACAAVALVGLAALAFRPLPDLAPAVAGAALAAAVLLVVATGALLVTRERLDRERAGLAARLDAQQELVREVQHRIANCLQLTASVLSLSAARVATVEQARTALDEAVQRLGVIARIHRRLADPAPDQAPPVRLIADLVRDLLASAGREDIAVAVDIAPGRFDGARMAALAMLTAEATLNALKHAFAGRRGGALTIVLDRRADGTWVLRIGDDGPGPGAGGVNGSAGLGMRVMESMARQLGGRVILRPGTRARPAGARGPGTVVELTFPD